MLILLQQHSQMQTHEQRLEGLILAVEGRVRLAPLSRPRQTCGKL